MEESKREQAAPTKKVYLRPALVVYGSIAKLTQNGNGSGADGGSVAGMTMSS